jgi:hypothetical protein
MTLITTGVALPLAKAAHRWARGDRCVRFATGAVSVGMGAWLVYQIGWIDGLFRAAPNWMPH